MLRNIKIVYTKIAIFCKVYTLYIYKDKIERTKMSGNSLQQYRDGVICSNTNKGWPQVNQSTDNTGNPNRMYSTNVGTILNGQNTPTINWNSPTVPDRILATNGLYSPVSSSSSSSGKNGWAIAGMVLGGVGALGSIALPLISLFKSKNENAQNAGFSKSERKEISRNTQDSEDSMTALNSCISTASSVDENTSQDTLLNINNNLTNAINTAEAQKSAALRNAETAKATKNTKTQALQSEQSVMDGLLNQKASISAQIDNLEKQDTSNMTDEQKAELKQKISDLKKQLKDVEDNIDKSQKKIDDLQAAIDVQDEIINQNTQTASAIEARLKSARTAAAKVDNMINNKDN